jgi:hypothetical protein
MVENANQNATAQASSELANQYAPESSDGKRLLAHVM